MTMTKKENQSRGGNNSLLQTARTKNFGAGKFALLSLKSKPQPPIKKVKVPISLPNNREAKDGKLLDDRSKVSDITTLSGEEKVIINRPAAINDVQQIGKLNDNNIEIESSVLGMSINSGNSLEFSLSKAFIPGTGTNVAESGDYAGKKQNAAQSTAFFSLWPASTGAVNTNHQHQQLHNHQFKGKKFVKSATHGKKGATVTKKKTMDISKGLRFSAPAPMTLNRYQPQMGQEKTAPESKEYLEMQARRIEAQHVAEAKIIVKERLKQAFELEEMDAGFFNDFDNENMNLVGNIPTKEKSLMKKILGKVRPKSSTKWQQNQEKSSAIQAAMAAAAAAVEAATGNPSGLTEDVNGHLSEEEARAIVNQALEVSRQKKKESSMHGLLDVIFRPSMIKIDHHQMATQEIDELGKPIQFPVNEVMMRPNEDSVSDLDASIRNLRKMPVVEVHMNNSKQYHGDGSVSTLGTPRIFEQLDKLLLSQPRRLQQRPGIIRDFLEDNMGGSAAPPPMVTSYDARALIDQLDSGTMVGDMTAGTARAENAVQFCNIASNCFHPEHKSLFMEVSDRNHAFEENSSALEEEESFDDSETSDQEKKSNDETWSSPTPAFTQAIDNAIRKAEIQIATNHTGQHKKDGGQPLSPIVEAGERMSPTTRPYKSKVGRMHPQLNQQTANFDRFMNIAASKLDKVNETACDSGYSSEINHAQKEIKNKNGTTPRTGVRKQSFGQKSSKEHFSDHEFDLLPDKKPGMNLVHDSNQLYKHLQVDEHNEKDVLKRKKHHGKSVTRVGARNDVMMDQGRFLLEKDDAYWDTLSTIASTANDRSSESDAYMDEFVRPGPIPGEITTSSSEMKSVTTPVIIGEAAIETNKHLEQRILPQSGEHLNEMMHDVTDLIDSDLLDNLPISKNLRSNMAIALSPEKDFHMISRVKKSSTSSNVKMTKKIPNQVKPYPEAVDRSKPEEKRSGNLAITSQIAKGIRSVSWGFEEIFEDKNPHLDLFDQDTNNSESSYSMTQKARPYPEGTHTTQHTSLYSADVQRGEEEDLLSRTLELSKGLLETIMGSQLIQEKKNKEEGQHVSSDDSRDAQYSKSHLNEYSTPTECRDDLLHEEKIALYKTRENDLPPTINNRLESLRNQRSRALSDFRQSQMQMQMQMSPVSISEKTESTKRDRDRLKNYSLNHDYRNLSSQEKDNADEYSNYQKAIMKQSHSGDSDIELNYTMSDSNASTTPSQKARDLRIQLDEAMRASREIQISQNELGNELNLFKKKYYKNPEIQQNYATKTVLGI